MLIISYLQRCKSWKRIRRGRKEDMERIRMGNGWSTQRSGVCWWLHSAVTIVMLVHNTTLYNNAIMHTDMTPHIAPLALIMSKSSISLGDNNEMLSWRWWDGCWVVLLSLLSHYPWSLVLVWHQPLLPSTRGASLAQINNIFIAESFWRDPKKIRYLHPCSVTHRGAIV